MNCLFFVIHDVKIYFINDPLSSQRITNRQTEFNGISLNELTKIVREIWCDEGAMIIDVLKENNDEFNFNVTKCLYAEIYKNLEVPELGKCLSCDRDFPFNEGFNPEITLERTKTIMEGADHCDFRYFKRIKN